MQPRPFFAACLFAAVIALMPVWAESGYRQPPERMTRIVMAPPIPQLAINPRGGSALMVRTESMTTVRELFQPVQRLAGIRFHPLSNTLQRFSFVIGVSLLDLKTGQEREVSLPPESTWGFPTWSPDGQRWAMTCYERHQAKVWVFDAATLSGVPLSFGVNNLLLAPFDWIDGTHLLLATVPAAQGSAPSLLPFPEGPNVQETTGRIAQVRTFQDLLKTDQDEQVFEHFATTQLVLISFPDGLAKPLGKPGLFRGVGPSPDGSLWLIDRILSPFSRAVPADMFAHRYEIWNEEGATLKILADLPDQEGVPIRGVPTGMRGVHWQPLASATLLWLEALDGGDPLATATHRDRLMSWPAPFNAIPQERVRIPERCWGLDFLASPGLTLLLDHNLETQWDRTWLFDLNHPASLSLDPVRTASGETPLLFSLSGKDVYNAPGQPVLRTLPDGQQVIRQRGNEILLSGAGATPQGDLPFVRLFDPFTRSTREIFRSATGTYEVFGGFADEDSDLLITRFETPVAYPNFRVRDLRKPGGEVATLTRFPDPAPELSGIRKELLQYKRADGIPLSGTLYYPVGYASGTRVPVMVWAYPREYVSPDMAGQVRAVPNRFAQLERMSILFMVLHGYAVLYQAEIPVVGKPLEANNTYVEQITAGAQAAVDQLVQMGVADRHRIGVGGHSYGAFMVANLLAHTDLFAAGVARSGAYNRTLTPFGFQAERRTYWQATDIYTRLSPFTHANRINEPLLLIHGEMDDNPGTFPIQSERLFAAVKGHGGTARLVVLPGESHDYRARESVLHVLAETVDWCDTYIKNRPVSPEARPEPGTASPTPSPGSH